MQALPTLLSIMNIDARPGKEASFEFQPDPTEGTCIDFSLPLVSRGRVNFEIKYSESEFGPGKADDSHLKKFETVYKSRLPGCFEEPFCCASEFLKHYR